MRPTAPAVRRRQLSGVLQSARNLQVRSVMSAMLVLAASSPLPSAQPAAIRQAVSRPDSVSLRALPGSSLTIRGSTSIGASWHCSAPDVRASAMLDAATTTFSVETIRAVSVRVPVWTLKCQSGAMERAMRKALRAETDTSSAIIGDFTSPPPTLLGDSTHGARLEGTLTVAGVTQPVRLDVTARQRGNAVGVESTLPLTLSGFSITPPRVWFGAIRARDRITVEVDLRFPRVLPER